ncbi:YebG family protein [Raoultella planticola]|uniref:YebG family protein n=1 Tax=Raoultella planticola TaxID=575 RepID=UPI0034E4EC48
MAVEIKYVVIREGEEKMSFTSKKEADAYDKMLDLAEVLNDWLVECPLTLDETQRDEMAMWLAERKETLHHILRSGKLPEAEAEDGTNGQASQGESSAAETSEAAAEGASEQPAATAPVKSRKVKAA